jgi:predicted dehydrogenase
VAAGPWTWDPKLSGGMIVEMLTHGFDLYNWYIGRPVRVYAAGNCTRRSNFHDNASVTISYENGAVVTVQGSWAAPDNYPTHKLELVGSEGAIYFEGGSFASGSSSYRLTLVDGKTAYSWENPGRGQAEKLRGYIDAIKSGNRKGIPTAVDGKLALEVALAAQLSLEGGGVVDLPLS